MATLRQAITARKAALTAQIETARQTMLDTIAPLQRALDVENQRTAQFAPWLDMELTDIQAELDAGISRYAADMAAR